MLKKRLSTFIISSVLIFLSSTAAWGQVVSELELFSDSFVSSSFGATSKSDYQFFAASLRTDPAVESDFRMDVSGAVAFGAPLLNYLNASELYFYKDLGAQQKLKLGRAKFLWSELDARWDLGVWEPVFKWNPLSAERQGLSGLFWQSEKNGIEVTLFASALFLPDQGPSFDLENGKFVRGNPWFRRPPESVQIFNETTAIEYDFTRPNESDIVFRTSYGGRLLLGEQEKVRLSLSYLYKPMNQLALAYDGALNIPKDRGVITIVPDVFYHTLLGADVVANSGRFRYGASGTLDKPNNEKVFAPELTVPVFTKAFLATAFLEYDSGPFLISIQRMEIFGGEISEEGKLATADRRPLMTRYSFRQANEVSGVVRRSLGKSRRFEVRGSLMGSDRGDFSLVKMYGKLSVSQLWHVFGEVQLVDAAQVSAQNQNEIAQYANNDRFMLGVSYVF